MFVIIGHAEPLDTGLRLTNLQISLVVKLGDEVVM